MTRLASFFRSLSDRADTLLIHLIAHLVMFCLGLGAMTSFTGIVQGNLQVLIIGILSLAMSGLLLSFYRQLAGDRSFF